MLTRASIKARRAAESSEKEDDDEAFFEEVMSASSEELQTINDELDRELQSLLRELEYRRKLMSRKQVYVKDRRSFLELCLSYRIYYDEFDQMEFFLQHLKHLQKHLQKCLVKIRTTYYSGVEVGHA